MRSLACQSARYFSEVNTREVVGEGDSTNDDDAPTEPHRTEVLATDSLLCEKGDVLTCYPLVVSKGFRAVLLVSNVPSVNVLKVLAKHFVPPQGFDNVVWCEIPWIATLLSTWEIRKSLLPPRQSVLDGLRDLKSASTNRASPTYHSK
jgi:hypothetical protein